jgi:ribosome biogenesis protein BRX1
MVKDGKKRILSPAVDKTVEQEVAEEEHKEIVDPERAISDGKYRNKQRCLVLCLRGATARYRHLLEDIRTLLPHHKKESKLDPGKSGIGRAVNDIAEIRGCNSVLFLECRKHQDAYMWLGRTGDNSGPSAKFHVTNVHTMDELRLTGNCMKGSRPILSFDESFERVGHLKLLKELFTNIFGTPRGHPKSKAFVDRVMGFYYADGKVSFYI